MNHQMPDRDTSDLKRQTLEKLRDMKVVAIRESRKHLQQVMMLSSGLAAFSAQILKSNAIDDLQSTFCILSMVCFLLTAAMVALTIDKYIDQDFELAREAENAVAIESTNAMKTVLDKDTQIKQRPRSTLRKALSNSPIYLFVVGSALLIAATLYMINVEKIVRFFWPMFHRC